MDRIGTQVMNFVQYTGNGRIQYFGQKFLVDNIGNAAKFLTEEELKEHKDKVISLNPEILGSAVEFSKVDFPIFDMLEKNAYIEELPKFLKFIEESDKTVTDIDGYRVGDVIHFTSGYNNDFILKSKITGFDYYHNQNCFLVLWDCYWFPVTKDRIVKI